MNFILFTLFAYLLGSIPFGLILCKAIKKIDIRDHGSKNIGATNVFRVAGKGLGLTVFFLDVLKGSFAVLSPVFVYQVETPQALPLLCGIIAILGHSFPIWLRFSGGKGVATSLGVFVALAPVPTLIAFVVFAITFGLTKILSFGSLIASIAFPVCVFVTERSQPDWQFLQVTAIFLTLFIFYTHRSNLRRLMDGEEKKLF